MRNDARGLRRLGLLMSVVLSTIWNPVNSNAMGKFPDDVPTIIAQCPSLIEYDAETLKKSATELRALLAKDAKAATPRLMRDYRVLRDGCRAYQKP
jgi:hypothetical protein